jgi:proteasome accessory factor A
MTDPLRLPKLIGGDVELGNFLLGVERAGGTGADASRYLLAEIDGLPRARSYRATYGGWDSEARWYPPSGGGYQSDDDSGWRAAVCGGYGVTAGERAGRYHATLGPSLQDHGYDSQDWGRKFLTNGQCAYIDLDHLELALPIVRSAYDYVACWHAALRVARHAMIAANQKQPPGRTIQVLVNNSDGNGTGSSYGNHLNILLARQAYENVFSRKMQLLLYLAAFQASSIVFTGQGKVGSDNGRPPVNFQLTQRADFLETLTAPWTTYRRPIVNSRDEPLCGRLSWNADVASPGVDMARLHVIFFDSTLCHRATLLRAGVMQIVVAMIEAERIDPDLILDDPLDAVLRWSHDPTLTATAQTVSRRMLTAVDMQWLFFKGARRFVDEGGCDGLVPQAEEILTLWEDTLKRLETRDLDRLAPCLDWALKLSILTRALDRRQHLSWQSPQVKHIDHLYSSLGEEGLYWAYERAGMVERLVPEERIEWFVDNPPADTRAWTRAMLLRRAGDAVEDVNWDYVRVRTAGRNSWPRSRTIDLADPLTWTRDQCQPVFERSQDLDELLDGLEALPAVRPRGSDLVPVDTNASRKEDRHGDWRATTR